MTYVDVAVIGGGFSGCALASILAEIAPENFSLSLFEAGTLGRGAAYGTAHREHLLNTRAHMMSLVPDDPGHFVDWLGSRGGPSDFVSRALYGEYIGEAAERAFRRPRFTHIPERAAHVAPAADGGFTIETSSATRLRARRLVLATGNLPPNDDFLPIEIRRRAGYVRDPWRFDYRRVAGDVLIIGSGLTALDVLVALQTAGHEGRIDVVSRHGRFPQVHADVAPYDVVPALDTQSAGSLLQSFRRHVEEAAARGFDWQAVLDALRPESEVLWRRVPAVEQRRFERHLRGRWDRHRHRAPQPVHQVRLAYENAGRLATFAGRLGANGENIVVAQRNGSFVSLAPQWIINCAGLGRAAEMARDPLLGALLGRGIISSSANGLGLRVTQNLNAVDAAGRVAPDLWIVGPLVRGSRFEATAVPEIRAMSETAAGQIVLAAHNAVRPTLSARQ
jgi:uncharacterized NAD(P)/FAD-binding protein YdhS